MDYELIKPDKDDAYDPAPFLSYARARSTDKQERDADVGDIVHWWDMVEARCLAAIVTVADLNTVHLTVFPPPGETLSANRAAHVPHDEGKTGPSWHWACGGH